MVVGEVDLKKKLGVMYVDDENREWHDSYPRNDKFQERVLKKAQEDVTLHTDMTFDYKPLKTGRRLQHIALPLSINLHSKLFLSKKKQHLQYWRGILSFHIQQVLPQR